MLKPKVTEPTYETRLKPVSWLWDCPIGGKAQCTEVVWRGVSAWWSIDDTNVPEAEWRNLNPEKDELYRGTPLKSIHEF